MSLLIGQSRPLVLVVDDDSRTIKILSTLLSSEGCDVVVACDGTSALGRLEERRPDIILLDVMMPGLDGFEVCRLLRSARPTRDVPIILLTALSDPSYQRRGLKLGAAAYVTKPFDHDELLQTIQQHLVPPPPLVEERLSVSQMSAV